MSKNIAIITARGGSKRIPKKNIKEFCGKPIITYAIESAINSGAYDTVMVSTDSEEIAEVAKKYGAEVPFFRSEGNSDDFAITADVLKEVLETYKVRGYTLKDDRLEMKWEEYYKCRSQDLEPIYHDAGQFYSYSVKDFLENDGIITSGIKPIVLDELEVQDIDNETDWKLAELKYRLIKDEVN